MNATQDSSRVGRMNGRFAVSARGYRATDVLGRCGRASTKGLVLAGAVALVFAGVVGFVVMNSKPTGGSGGSGGSGASGVGVGAPPKPEVRDIKDLAGTGPIAGAVETKKEELIPPTPGPMVGPASGPGAVGTGALGSGAAPGGAGSGAASGGGQPNLGGVQTLRGGSRPFAQFVDKKDPTKIRGEISAEKSDPDENQRVRMEKPRGWSFLEDGRTLYVEADKGRVLISDDSGGRPSDALLEGNVIIKMFPPQPGGVRPDPKMSVAIITVKTDLLKFDGALGQVDVPGAMVVTSPQADFEGAGVVAQFNEVRGRVEFMRIASTKMLRFRPSAGEKVVGAETPAGVADGAKDGAAGASAVANAAGSVPVEAAARSGGVSPTAKPDGAAVAKAEGEEAEYRVEAQGAVRVTQGGRTITADRFEVWTRLIDNTLRSGAIAMMGGSGAGGDSAGGFVGDGGLVLPFAAAAMGNLVEQPGTSAAGLDEIGTKQKKDVLSFAHAAENAEPVELTWTGPMEMRPLTTASSELLRDDVFVRFTSDRANGVTLADASIKLVGSGSLLEYGATSRNVALAAPAGMKSEETWARLEAEGAGVASGERLELAIPTGKVSVPGAGELRALAKDESPVGGAGIAGSGPVASGTLRWSRQANFDFVVRDNAMTGLVAQARAEGSVVATSGNSELRGEYVQAAFVQREDASVLTTLVVTGNGAAKVTEANGENRSLKAGAMTLTFSDESTNKKLVPLKLVASGGVEAAQGTAGLTATDLVAELGVEKGATVIAQAVATGNVRFVDAGGAVATANELRATPQSQVAVLIGSVSSPAAVAQGESRVEGPQITLRGGERSLTVDGVGEFTHKQVASGGVESTAKFTWSRSMSFVDATGRLECNGLTGAEWAVPNVSRDTARGNSLVVQLDPGGGSANGSGSGNGGGSGGARKIRTAELIGTADQRAVIESRRYSGVDPTTASLVLDRLVYVEGERIIGDNTTGMLTVPAAGRLLSVDAKRGEPRAASSGGGDVFTSGASGGGRALFTWKGSLVLERPKGVATLREGVRIVHDREVVVGSGAGGGGKTELESDMVVAQIAEFGPAAATLDSPFNGSLRTADATGRVWMRTAGREMTADELSYDAVRSIVDAQGNGGRLVQVTGQAGAEPITAAKITWDLTKDRIDAKQVGPVVAPR